MEDSRDRSRSNLRQELLAAVAVAAEDAVHREAAVGEGRRGATGNCRNGEQGSEDDGPHGRSPGV